MNKSLNIYSGGKGLAAALTNPTWLAKVKGNLSQSYPVSLGAMIFRDAEEAYQALKNGDTLHDDELMVLIICEKFTQYQDLLTQVKTLGGADFLKTCRHFVNAKTIRGKSWEGIGMESRFIRNLVAGYLKAVT